MINKSLGEKTYMIKAIHTDQLLCFNVNNSDKNFKCFDR